MRLKRPICVLGRADRPEVRVRARSLMVRKGPPMTASEGWRKEAVPQSAGHASPGPGVIEFHEQLPAPWDDAGIPDCANLCVAAAVGGEVERGTRADTEA